MSHFAGLVIMTPKYEDIHTLEESLEKYDENLEVPEYSRGVVSKFEKIRFMEYYSRKNNNVIEKSMKPFYDKLVDDNIIEPFVNEDINGMSEERYISKASYGRDDEFADFILSLYPKYLNHFKRCYKRHGDEWNGNRWRISTESGKLEEYSKYNPESVYDWYTTGGRWNNSIKTKDNEFVNECYLNEIDWTDFTDDDYEKEEKTTMWGKKYKELKKDRKWHFTKSNIPYTLFVDGIHYSQGEMGWWGMSKDDMTDDEWRDKFFEIINSLPEDSEVSLVDFHI